MTFAFKKGWFHRPRAEWC